MSNKQIALLAVYTILVVVVSVVLAESSDSATKSDHDVAGKSYFGYQPQQKDSYKKLVQDVEEFCNLYFPEFDSLKSKIEAIHKKLYHKKEHGGHYNHYNDMEKMQKVLSQQKAALDALRSDRPSA